MSNDLKRGWFAVEFRKCVVNYNVKSPTEKMECEFFWKNLKRKYRILVREVTPYFRTVSKLCGPFLHEIVGLRTDDIEQWTPTSIERLLETKKTTWFSKHYRLQEWLKQLLLQPINSRTGKAHLKDSHSLLRIIIKNPTSKMALNPKNTHNS